MIKSINELLNDANTVLGENNGDEVLAFIGDLSDTLNSLNDSEQQIATLKAEKQQLDETWRKKYRERFFSATPPDDEPPIEDAPKKRTYEELFS